MSNETWYSGESWYAPLADKKEETPAVGAGKKPVKKVRRGWRAAFWCCLCLLVLVRGIINYVRLRKQETAEKGERSFHRSASIKP